MMVCPKCGSVHPDGTEFCPDDGAPLDSAGGDPSLDATALGTPGPHDTRPNAGATSTEWPKSEKPPDDPLVGKVVGGVYRVLHQIGLGGMGVVYAAEHVNLHKRFAVKILSRVMADHPEAAERFKQEAISASKIEHDNIVDVVSLDSTPEGDLFIVMELLHGESLASAQKVGPMPPERALPIAYQICRGLHAAHEADIIHRDLKPENVFLLKRGEADFVKILDFGISKIRDAESQKVRITRTGQVLGTPLYMSPEQARGLSKLDRRVDIYSLGVILYEMLTGRPPFTGENYFQLIWKHSNESPPPLGPEVPAPLAGVVLKLLSKDPDGRYATMLEVEEALAEAVPEVPPPSQLVSYRPSVLSSPPPRLTSPPSPTIDVIPRTPIWIWVAALAGLAALALAAVALALRDGQGEGRTDSGRATLVPVHDASHEQADVAVVEDERDAATDRVRIRVESDPPGAAVFLGAERIGDTPLDVTTGRTGEPTILRLVKPGYRPVSREVSLAEDVSVSERLSPTRDQQPGKGIHFPFKRDY